MTLKKWVHDPIILGSRPIFKGSWRLQVDLDMGQNCGVALFLTHNHLPLPWFRVFHRKPIRVPAADHPLLGAHSREPGHRVDDAHRHGPR